MSHLRGTASQRKRRPQSAKVPSRSVTAATPTAAAPAKPYAGFPMYAHASGQWAKKIGPRMFYFGSWRNDREGTAALERFNLEYPYLKEGRTPPEVDVSAGCTIKQLVNEFLRSKEAKMHAGELSPATFRQYHRACAELIDQFSRERKVSDLRPEDFRAYRTALAKRLGPVAMKGAVNVARIIFAFAFDNNLIEKPVNFGQEFERPTALALRRDRNEAGAKLFERHEVLRILAALDGQPDLDKPDEPPPWNRDPALKAMALLALNGGLGNCDCGNLRKEHIAQGWVNYPRPKTAIDRRIPLWPETLAALDAAARARPAAAVPAYAEHIFLTRLGQPFIRTAPPKESEESEGDLPKPGNPADAISGRFRKLLKKLGINGRRSLGFYTFRHCFETFAGESRDQVAVDAIMGHVPTGMSANYRHRISDERLRAVVDVVHDWLWPKPKANPKAKADDSHGQDRGDRHGGGLEHATVRDAQGNIIYRDPNLPDEETLGIATGEEYKAETETEEGGAK